MVDRSVRPPTLIRIITLRIALFAALAMTVQAALVFADYYFDNEQLATLMIERETGKLSKGFERRHDEAPYKLPHDLVRYGIQGGFYITRIPTSLIGRPDAKLHGLISSAVTSRHTLSQFHCLYNQAVTADD